jgi:hypothetical protein
MITRLRTERELRSIYLWVGGRGPLLSKLTMMCCFFCLNLVKTKSLSPTKGNGSLHVVIAISKVFAKVRVLAEAALLLFHHRLPNDFFHLVISIVVH